jgi:CBS domain containing-hemolysin-like protein
LIVESKLPDKGENKMDSVIINITLAILKILAALGLVSLNALFVAAEFAFVRVRPTRLTQLIAEGNRKAGAANQCVNHLDAYLSVSQLGITLSSLGLGWLGEPAVASLLKPLLTRWGLGSPALVTSISFIVAFSLITFIHVVFGELAPKSLAIQKAENIALWLARPMQFFYRIFYPAVVLLNGTANWFIARLGFEPPSDSAVAHSEEELRILISESYKSGQINATEQELLENVFRFEEKVAEEIMVPRPDVVFLDMGLDLQNNIETARKSGHTRFPLIDGNPDEVIGVINIKDLMYLNNSIEDLSEIKREALFIPESMPLDKLLAEFQKRREHLVIVIDEYGGTAGIVSLEDVLEELVGDIQDEYDHEEPEYIVEENGTILASGRMFIDDAVERFKLPLDNEEQYNTLAGYVLGKLGKSPREGDEVTEGHINLKIIKMDGMRIDLVRLRKIKKGDSAPSI